MDEKELFDNLDLMDIPDSAKNKVKKMLKKKQEKTENMEERKELAKLIAMELKDVIPDGKKWLEAIKDLEVKSPKVEVNIPEIKIPSIEAPEVKIPAINIPKIETPIVNIPKIEIPKIELPKIEIPKQEITIPNEMEVKGMIKQFKDLEKSIGSIVKNKLSVVLHGGIDNTGTVERDNPIPVIPVDENGKVIKGGGGINQVRSGGNLTSYLSDMKVALNKLLFHDGHLKTLGYYEAIGHGATNDIIIKERASGDKTGIGTGDFTIIESHPFIQPPTGSDVAIYMQSTSAEDGIGGIGAIEITVEYFVGAWGDLRKVTKATNGITQVDFGVSMNRIHKIYINKVGSSQKAEGDITITNQAGTILYGQIDDGQSEMERCIFYVAEGKQVTCTEISIGSVTSGGVEIRLIASEEDSNGNIVPRKRIPFELVSGGEYIKFTLAETVANPNNKRMALLLVVKAAGTASNQSATGAMKGITEPIET